MNYYKKKFVLIFDFSKLKKEIFKKKKKKKFTHKKKENIKFQIKTCRHIFI